ncbi:E6 protein [Bos taurus papillomavirus 19]|uniref:Protein E6 n=1 Tax=Bos taurus papillomavirus 19 TaxID=1887217 RepID=A0A1B2K209_9PAPI|nr:E6 protein [Bos taurus papillomavirus 19]ANZ90250.1 E6 protein [Bos taurus papillomavirus 19]
MAAYPTLTALLKKTPYTRATLPISCVFCKQLLTVKDKELFVYKKLKLVIRDSEHYAACDQCIIASAKLDAAKYTQCTIEGDGVMLIARKSLDQLHMRCVNCAKYLSNNEKLECVVFKIPFHLIRNDWRGLCRNCLLVHHERGGGYY